MTLWSLIFRYSAFAGIATFANLAAQRMVLAVDSTERGLVLAILCGTLAGLVTKYILDKRWIFYNFSTGLKSHSRLFTLYTGNGIFTTILFWITEAGFWLIWQTDFMREVGAILGLTIGYVIKYQLDRRYVFTDSKLIS